MNIIDVVIVLLVLFGALIGFKRGFTKQLVSFLGIFLIIIFAFILKNPVSIFLYEHLPFFPFGGILKGVTVLNIALYEVLALVFVMGILFFIFRILLFATSIFEKILNFTIILGIPSKILGAVIGAVEAALWLFIGLYIMSLPLFNFDIVSESKYKDLILNNTPFLSSIVDNSMKVVDEFISLKDKYEVEPNATEFNKDTLDLFLKYNVITIESVDKLIDSDKLKIDNVEHDVLQCYRTETKNSNYCLNREED